MRPMVSNHSPCTSRRASTVSWRRRAVQEDHGQRRLASHPHLIESALGYSSGQAALLPTRGREKDGLCPPTIAHYIKSTISRALNATPRLEIHAVFPQKARDANRRQRT